MGGGRSCFIRPGTLWGPRPVGEEVKCITPASPYFALQVINKQAQSQRACWMEAPRDKYSVDSSMLLPPHHSSELGHGLSSMGGLQGAGSAGPNLLGLQSTGRTLPIQGPSNPCLVYLPSLS